MTDEQIGALRAAAEAATPGPWRKGYLRHGYAYGTDYLPRDNRWVDADYVVSVANSATQIAGTEDGVGTPQDATYIAAASPDVVLALLAERDALRAQRDNARAKVDRAVQILVGIHGLMNPPTFDTDGHTFVFTHDAINRLQKLSDAIRAIPDRIDAALKGEP
jgi:hypothetical protein